MKSLIQIGTNDGNDDVFSHVKANPYDFILLVDANPFCLERAKLQYKDIANVKFQVEAIAGDNREATLFIPTHDYMKGEGSEHSSLKREHVVRVGHDTSFFKEVKVKCKTFSDLMGENNLTELDKLFIDVEGIDAEILLSLDLVRYNIQEITFEHYHMTHEERTKVWPKLSAAGYSINSAGQFNSKAVKQKS